MRSVEAGAFARNEALAHAGVVARGDLEVRGEATFRETAGRDRLAGFAAPVDIGGEGHIVRLAWAGAAGATDVEVSQAELVLGTAFVVRDQPALPVAVSGNHADITIPAHERVRSVTLRQLRHDGATDLLDEAGLSVAQLRLTVALAPGQPPVHAAPAVSVGQMMPPILGGASYAAGVLRLPDVAAGKLRLNLVQGATPTEFSRQALSLAGASGVTLLPSRGVSVTGPDGKSVFASPGELPDVSGGHEVDCKPALRQAFGAALAAGQPLSAEFKVRGEAGCQAYVRRHEAHGALLRVQAGVLRTEVEGGAAELLLDGPLDAAAPQGVRGDLTVKYLGLRVPPELSDEVPPSGGAGGLVVRESAAWRALPPAALAGQAVARAGLIGRAPEPCELSVQLCEDAGGTPGRPLGKPGTLKLAGEPGAPLACHWVELPPLPESAAGARGLLLALRVTSGRFFWATGAQDRPRLRIAVRDPDPGGRPLRLGGHTLLEVREESVHLPGFLFPAAAFARAAAGASAGAPAGAPGGPRLHSELFLTVDCSDLTLRYPR
jgi:hypothetical protein